MRRVAAVVLGAVLVLTGCAPPHDDDGEVTVRAVTPAGPTSSAATPVVVDTDLGADDLAALTFLLRHPSIEVEAITIAGTGLVRCDPGIDIVADLLTALREESVPVACSTAVPGPGALELPEEWRRLAETGTGIPRFASTLTAEQEPARSLLAKLTRQHPDLVLVALGPMTTAAELAETAPAAFARLAGIHAMGGSVQGEPINGVAEWNVAADPGAFETVLASAVPLTIVPEDAVPDGTPESLRSAPVVAQVAATAYLPQWWDLAAVAALVGDAADTLAGHWVLDHAVPGRLIRSGDGGVQVVQSLDADELEVAYSQTLG